MSQDEKHSQKLVMLAKLLQKEYITVDEFIFLLDTPEEPVNWNQQPITYIPQQLFPPYTTNPYLATNVTSDFATTVKYQTPYQKI